MRFSNSKTSKNKENRGSNWLVASGLLVLTAFLLIATPVHTIAQVENATPAQQIQEQPAAPTVVPVQPTTVPPTAVPTQVPPTAVPTAVPTQIPPTSVPTVVPTQEPTAVPTQEPTAVPTEKVWVNTDSLRVTDGVTAYTVQQGGAATLSITYNVTTPRTSTTIYARLSGATDGWTISSPQLPDADASATTATWTQTSTLEPGTAFNLPVVITAPATVAQDHSVSLHLWSVAAGEKGQEAGVARTDLRIATINVLAPPPTPTIEPTATPTQEPTIVPTQISSRDGNTSIGPATGLLGEEYGCKAEVGEMGAGGVVLIGDEGYAKFKCSFKDGPGQARWSEQNLSSNWKVSLTGSNDYSRTAPNGATGDQKSIYIYLKPDDGVTGIGSLQFIITKPGNYKPESDIYLPVTTLKASKEAPPATPSPTPVPPTKENLVLDCEPESVALARNISSDVTCTISSASMMPGTEVTVSKLEIEGSDDIDLIWEEQVVASPHTVTPVNATVTSETSYSFSFSLEQTACSVSDFTVAINTWFSYAGKEQEGPSTSLNVTGETVFHPLSVALTGTVDFGTMTWDGERYVAMTGDGVSSDSSSGSTMLTVSRGGDCGSPKPEKIRITTTGSQAQPGLVPEYQEASIPQGVAISSIDGDQLQVDPEFSGDANVGLTFTLTPPKHAVPGEYSDMNVTVTIVNGQ